MNTNTDPKEILRQAIAAEKAGDYVKSLSAYKDYLKQRPSFERTIAPSIKRCTAKAKSVTRKISSSNSPILSIIIPCYNSGAYINQCLTSVRQQKLRQIEIIVVDDGSTDETQSIIEKHAAIDSRILHITNITPSGNPGKPRNQALDLARGTFIGFVDSDDWVDREYFSDMVATAMQNNADLVVGSGHRNIIPESSIKERRYEYYYFNDSRKMPCTYHPSSMIWDKIYKRDLLQSNSIYLGEGKAAVDVIFVVKAYYYCSKAVTCATIGYNYRRETDSSVTVRQRKSTDCQFEIDSYVDCFEWAKINRVSQSHIYFIQLKQFTSFVYTLKLVKADYFNDYFYKCSRRLEHYNDDSFREVLICTKSFYLWETYNILRKGQIQSFIKQERPDLEPYIIESAKHIIPKTLVTPANSDRSSIIFFPDWSYSNPYQRLLYQSLSRIHGVGAIGLEPSEVNEANLRHLSKKARILHLHWSHPFTNNEHESSLFELLEKAKNDFGMNIIWTVHNIVPHGTINIDRELDIRKRLSLIAKTLICHSRAAKRRIVRDYRVSENRILVMEHGLYPVQIPPSKIIEISLERSNDRHLRLLIAGDLKPYKNVEWAISFLNEVNRDLADNSQIYLAIKGKPSSSEQDRFLQDSTKMYKWLSYSPGRLSDDKFSMALIESDFVFLPYQRVLTSGIAVNALSHGKPFIAPFSEELDELGDKKCKLLYRDVVELKSALKYLANNKMKPGPSQFHDPATILEATIHLQWDNIVAKPEFTNIFGSSSSIHS